MDDALARQMLRQGSARRPLALEAFHRDFGLGRRRSGNLGLGLGLRGILFQISELKLIFYSTNSQAIERTQKSAPEKRLGTTFRVIWRDWDQVSAT
jgi:hypothetical protein